LSGLNEAEKQAKIKQKEAQFNAFFADLSQEPYYVETEKIQTDCKEDYYTYTYVKKRTEGYSALE
jgi:hypothetical protein